ncbi:MAG: MBL fold metallo-hydrolase [Oscillospiraceae bacterium]
MIFLGTGASEAIPCCFCDCVACNDARTFKGKNIRSRCGFMIDEQNLIDFSPDIFKQCLDNNLVLSNLQNIFLTHTHDDHLDISELITINSSASNEQVNIYLSQAAAGMFTSVMEHYENTYGSYTTGYFKKIKLKVLNPYETYRIDERLVTPIQSTHRSYGKDEWGFNYLIQDKDNQTFLYATDTGFYSEKAFAFLSGKRLNQLIIECTYGVDDTIDDSGHLSYRKMLKMLDCFKECGIIDYTTPIYVTHISHVKPLVHEALQGEFHKSNYHICVAYDGLVI